MIKPFKRIFFGILLFVVLWAVTCFAGEIFYDNFEEYPIGDLSESINWRINKGESALVSVAEYENTKVLKTVATNISYIQKSEYVNLADGDYVFNVRFKFPTSENGGSVNVGLRGLGGESTNRLSLCNVNGSVVTYLPFDSSKLVTEDYDNNWFNLTVYMQKNGSVSVYKDGVLKKTCSDYKITTSGSRFNVYNSNSSLRITATPAENEMTVYYDDIIIFKNISVNPRFAVSEAIFEQALSETDNFDESTKILPYLKSGNVNAKLFINNLAEIPPENKFSIFACRYNDGELVSFNPCDFENSENYGNIAFNIPSQDLTVNDEIKIICIDSDENATPQTIAKSYVLPDYVRYFPNELEEMYKNSNLFGVHPRIMMTSADFLNLKEKFDSGDELITKWCSELISEAEEIIEMSPVSYSISEGGNLLAKSRRVLNRMTVLGLAYNITGDTRYSERAWKELKAAGEFPDWNPEHFFSTAEMTAAFAIGYDWMYDAFDGNYSEDLTKREFIENCILNKGISYGESLYLKMIYKSAPFVSGGNQNAVANGGMVLGALALADKYPQRSFNIISNSLESLPYCLKSFAPDGAWYEGPDYWRYTVQYLTMLTAGVESVFGTDFGIPYYAGIEESMEYIYHMRGPVAFYNYHDSDGACNSPVMFYYAKKFNRPEFEKLRMNWLNNNMEAFMPLDLVYYKGIFDDDVASLPLDKYFGGEEIVTMRSSWEDKDALYVASHAGKAETGHSHLDCGSFVLDYSGVRWASDLGRESLSYTNSYSDDKKYDLYRLRPEGHNTLVINPDSEPGQELSAITRIEKYNFDCDNPFAILELTSAYATYAQSVKRGFKLINNRTAVNIRDEITLENSGEIYWFMHTEADVTFDGNTAILKKDGKTMYLKFSSNATSAEFLTDLSASPLPSSPNPEGQADNSAYKRIAIKLRGNGSIYLDVCISANSNEEINSISLSQWN